jgi:hypothetical protein
MNVARELLTGLIDYAGLFPPASLDMTSAVTEYRAQLAGDQSFILGRFIVPASRLDELEKAIGTLPGESTASLSLTDRARNRWQVSVIADREPVQVAVMIADFNSRQQNSSSLIAATCDAVEVQVKSADAITVALDTFPDSVELFLEIPLDSGSPELIECLRGTRAAAKIRTGGVVPGAIPPASEVVRFIRACWERDVPFKATAGLHHAIRGAYPLTYESDAPTATLFGYLNIFLAAAFLAGGADEDDVVSILEETDASAFDFDDKGVTWRGHTLTAEDIGNVRRDVAISFGSCSFSEPVGEAKAIGLL